MAGFRDEVILLEPDVKVDPYTETSTPDWDKAPLSATPATATVQPLSSQEAAVTAETIIARCEMWVRDVATWEGVFASTWRVIWHGDTYHVDGEVEPWRHGQRTRYLACYLKKIQG